MFYVMSAEEVDGHIEPFLHAICERKEDATKVVEKIVRSYDVFCDDQSKDKVKRGHNDQDKWADKRWDSDGTVAWNTVYRPIGIFVKEINMTKKGILAEGLKT